MSSEASPGRLFIVSAPSGAGKTTLIRHVLETFPDIARGIAFSVSHTTRAARPGEREGVDYFFVDRERFERMIDNGCFLEWARVYGQYKGTGRAAVVKQLEAGIDVILDIDVQGARQVQSQRPGACSIFVAPPSYEELERRLRTREVDDPEEIGLRLAAARGEMEQAASYDFVIINRDVARAGRALAAVLLADRHRRDRVQARVERALTTFP